MWVSLWILSWIVTSVFCRNPHVLDVLGISPASFSPPYIIFRGGILYFEILSWPFPLRSLTQTASLRLDTRRIIASVLETGERQTAALASQITYGIASAFDYLSQTSSCLRLADLAIECFDVFSDDTGNTVLAFTPDPVGITSLNMEANDVTVFDSFMTKVSILVPGARIT
jgi:hypothetical protein